MTFPETPDELGNKNDSLITVMKFQLENFENKLFGCTKQQRETKQK